MFSVKFASLEELMDFLPEDEAALLEQARFLVQETLPDLKERISYNVPYFRGFRDVCFLWPASVLWGSKKSYEGLRFGFAQGYLLQNPAAYLDRGTRKQVFWKDLTSIKPADESALRSLLLDADRADAELREGLGR